MRTPLPRESRLGLTLDNYRRFFQRRVLQGALLPDPCIRHDVHRRNSRHHLPGRVLPDADRQPPKPVAHASPVVDSVLGRRNRAHLRNHDPARQQRSREPAPEVARPDREADTVHVHGILDQRRNRLPHCALHAPAAVLRPGEAPDGAIPKLPRIWGRARSRDSGESPCRSLSKASRQAARWSS